MAGKLEVPLRHRTFYFAWCDRTEIDTVCLVCGAIVPGETCQHCQRTKERKAERLRTFLAKKAEEPAR